MFRLFITILGWSLLLPILWPILFVRSLFLDVDMWGKAVIGICVYPFILILLLSKSNPGSVVKASK